MSEKRKYCIVIGSDTDHSGGDDQLPVIKKSRQITESDTEDNGSDGTMSHPPIPRSPRSLDDEEGDLDRYQLPIDTDPDSPTLSIVQEEESERKQERPINHCILKDLSSSCSKYVTNFHENKEELARSLFDFFNDTVFYNELPSDMEIIWSKRMNKTAGVTRYREENGQQIAIINLSEKVCDSADRVRDTLIHEMCHAACWVIDGDPNAGHGWRWKFFCQTAASTHPELPPITQYHDFKINFPVIYECSGCQHRVGRWKASLDTDRFVCGHCSHKMVLLNSNLKHP